MNGGTSMADSKTILPDPSSDEWDDRWDFLGICLEGSVVC